VQASCRHAVVVIDGRSRQFSLCLNDLARWRPEAGRAFPNPPTVGEAFAP
jgi:hypothetical protein